MITLETDVIDSAIIRLNELSSHGVGEAMSRAMNRAILAAQTAGVQAVGKEYVIQAKSIKANITIKKASHTNLQAILTTRGPALDLMKFKVRAGRKGVFAQVKRDGGGIIPRSFFIVTGRAGIYYRDEDAPRLPIQRAFGPSVPQMMDNTAVEEAMVKHSSEVLESRIEHEIDRALGV